MVKVSVMYPQTAGAKFDWDYYLDTHVPLLEQRLAPACRGITVERGIGGTEPDSAAAFLAMVHIQFESVDAFQQAFVPHAQEIAGDVANYTDIQPAIQISDVVR